MTRISGTPYIEWAKLQQASTYNLAVSGVPHATFDDIGGIPRDMPLSGANAYGYAPLLEAIAARHHVPTSHVVTTTGCSMANVLALAAAIAPGDEVLIERPTYEPLLLAAAHLGAAIARFERRAANNFAIDADEIAAAVTPRTRLIVIANLHNPSSQTVDGDTLRTIGEAAARVGARVLVDEIYLDAVFDHTPASAVHLGPTFISTNSLTKVYGLSALRCGWIIADEALARRAWRINDLYGNVAPFAPDVLATQAFEHLPHLRERARTLLDRNRAIFAGWAQRREDIAVVLPRWGTTVCVRPLRVGADILCTTLRERHDVTVVPGRFFELADYVRVGLSTDTHILQEGLDRIDACLIAMAS